MRKRLVALFASLSLCLTACNFFSPNNWINSSGDSQGKGESEYPNSFVDTKGVTHYMSVDKPDIYLLQGMSETLYFSMYKEGETPYYHESSTNSSLKWVVDDESIVSISNKEVKSHTLVTAKKVGETRVSGTIFSGKYGASSHIHVLEKKLTSLELKDVKKTYLLGSTFVPRFTCFGIYSDIVREEIDFSLLTIDSSKVNTGVEGTYTVDVSYQGFKTSYQVKVIDNPTYSPKSLDYTYNDERQFRTTGWYCPSKGNVKTLVLPIWFKDSNKYFSNDKKSQILADLNTAFYGEGNSSTGWNSVKSFYKTTSQNRLNLSGNVGEWYDANYYVTDFENNPNTKIKDVVNKAIDNYFNSHPSEVANSYDSDNNGYFDGVYVIYGVNDSGEEHPEIPSTFWGKISFENTRAKTDSMPGIGFYMWASVDSLYEDNSVSSVDSHTFIHEFGHTLGLADYYDYGENEYYTVGGHIIMFHNTGEQDPYSTLSLGWSKVYVPETSCTIELNDYQSNNTSILLSTHPESVNSPFDEYILVELYSPKGINTFDTTNAWKGFYSRGAQEPCVRLWHVDARLAKQLSENNYQFGTNPLEDGYSIAFTNTWGDNHGTKLGRDYDDYSLLTEIRNNKEISFKPKSKDVGCMFNDVNSFHTGDVVDFKDYATQFKNGTKLNSNEELGWKIEIESIYSNGGNGYAASINLTYEF